MSTSHPDHSASDDGKENSRGAGDKAPRATPDAPDQGRTTGSKQAAKNRENDPPA